MAGRRRDGDQVRTLHDLGDMVGVYFTDHDLRRAYGRMMYRSRVRIEKMAKIFGPAATRTTMHYLGLDFEDMDEAMVQYGQYQKSFVVPKMVQNEEGLIIGGQGDFLLPEPSG